MPRRTRVWLGWPLLAAFVAVLAFAVCTLHTGLMWRGEGGGYLQFGWGAFSVGAVPLQPGEPTGWAVHHGGLPGWSFGLERSPGRGWVAIIPLWAPAMALAIAAAASFRRPMPPGRCRKCGYDRAGLEAGAVCPECGVSATAAQQDRAAEGNGR